MTSEGCQSWLRLTDRHLAKHHESELLQEFALKYATRLSYAKTSQLVFERSGTSSLSDQRIYQMVEEKALGLTSEQKKLIRANEKKGVGVKAVKAKIYEAQAEEVVFLGDGVCVSQQKSVRDKKAKEGKERTTTDLAMLKKRDGTYRTIVAGEGVSRVKLYEAEIVREYGEKASALPVVALTDGARGLKNEVKKLFGEEVSHILDWYHLEAKVYQLMTQIAPNKEVKEKYNKMILNQLWKGESRQAISCLEEIEARQEKKKGELKGYLEKNEAYIINYEKRRAAGKIIGSGRLEKQNDVIVAQRQKRKGMSWSKSGSRNLAIVTAYFNQGTNYLQ